MSINMKERNPLRTHLTKLFGSFWDDKLDIVSIVFRFDTYTHKKQQKIDIIIFLKSYTYDVYVNSAEKGRDENTKQDYLASIAWHSWLY